MKFVKSSLLLGQFFGCAAPTKPTSMGASASGLHLHPLLVRSRRLMVAISPSVRLYNVVWVVLWDAQYIARF